MNTMRHVLAATSGAILASGPWAVAQTVSITRSGGEAMLINRNEIVNGEREIELLVVGSPDAVVAVVATSGSNPIRYIRVRSVRGTGFSTGRINLVLTEAGGTVTHVREISRLADTVPAELLIGLVEISGIAGPPTHDGSGFTAEIVGQVIATGNVTADIVSGPLLFDEATQNSTVQDVRSTSGSILGSVTAPQGVIDFVRAPQGDIGTSASPVTISAKHSVKTIEARRIWADIDATINGGDAADSQVWRVSASAGDFVGSLTARRIDGLDGNADQDDVSALTNAEGGGGCP
jgi:hypothetical protein